MSFTRLLFDKKFVFPNDLQRLELNGKVKEIKIRFDQKYYPDLNDDDPFRGFESDHKEYYKDLFFNYRGNLKEEVQYMYFDEVEYRSYFNYNERNELMSKIVEGIGIMNFVERYTYHYYLNQIRITNSFREHSIRKIKLKNGKISVDIYIPDTQKRYFHKTTFSNGRLIEIDSTIRTTMFYNSIGNLIKKNYSGIFDKNTVFRSEQFEYDDNNQIIKGMVYCHGKLDSYLEFDYDQKGNWIKKRMLNDQLEVINEINRYISYYTTENS
jgi:hypothetical protein